MWTRLRLILPAVLLALAFPLGALAQESPQLIELPPGVGCEFGLNIYVTGSTQVHKEFTDKNGNIVRILDAGKGSKLTFENTSTGATVSLRPNGSVTHTTVNPDGSTTVMSTGHNVLILFPSDIPAGPSTTLYVGRVVYTVDTSFVFTLQSSSGKKIDICARLAN